MYRNKEGYADPTAGAAMSKVMKEYREKQKKTSKREKIKALPKVYVVSRYAGNVIVNTAEAIRYCRYVIGQQRIPIASHLMYPQILDDNSTNEREIGLLFGQTLLALCDEVWVFGTEYSTGMEAEIEEAHRLNKPLRFFKDRMEETYEIER